MSDTATTTRTPIDTVRAVYDCFERGDVPGVLELFDPEIEIRQSEELPWGGHYRGHEEAIGFFTKLMSRIQTKVSIERLIHAGDHVVEIGQTRGHAVGSQREFAIDEIHVWGVRDGRIVSMTAYVDNAAMLAAIAA